MIAQVREQLAVHDVLQYKIMRLCNQRKSRTLYPLYLFAERRIGACRIHVSCRKRSQSAKDNSYSSALIHRFEWLTRFFFLGDGERSGIIPHGHAFTRVAVRYSRHTSRRFSKLKMLSRINKVTFLNRTFRDWANFSRPHRCKFRYSPGRNRRSVYKCNRCAWDARI